MEHDGHSLNELNPNRKLPPPPPPPLLGMAVPEASMEQWWSFARWIMIFAAMILLYGLMLTHGLLNDVYYVKFPHLCMVLVLYFTML
jgi:hypothetical protein